MVVHFLLTCTAVQHHEPTRHTLLQTSSSFGQAGVGEETERPPWLEEWGGGASVENPHVQRVHYCELLVRAAKLLDIPHATTNQGTNQRNIE